MNPATCFCTMVAVILTITVASDRKREKEVVTKGIRYLADDQEFDPEVVSALINEVDPSSPLRPVAFQACSYLCLKGKDYSRAWKLLSQNDSVIADSSQSMQLGHDRIKLWLMMESGQTEKATELLKRLVRKILNDELSTTDQRSLADFLGGICGVSIEDPHPSAIPREVITRSISLLEGHPSNSIATQFCTRLEAIRSAAAELSNVIDYMGDLSEQDAEAALRQAFSDLRSCESGLEIAREQYDIERRELRKKHEATLNHERNIRRVRFQITNTELDGKPSMPTFDEVEPRMPSGSRYDKDADKSKWSDYDARMRKYERKLLLYQKELEAYPAKLAEWQSLNEQRRQRLIDEHSRLTSEITQVKAREGEQREVFDRFEKLFDIEDEKFRRAEYKAKFIEASIRARKEGGSKSIHRPSLFQVINFSAEMDRLLLSTSAVLR